MKIASFPFNVYLTMFLRISTTKSIHFLKACNMSFQTRKKNWSHDPKWLPFTIYGNRQSIRLFHICLQTALSILVRLGMLFLLCTHLQQCTSDFLFCECCASYGQRKKKQTLISFCIYSLSAMNGIQYYCIPCNPLDLNLAKKGHFLALQQIFLSC